MEEAERIAREEHGSVKLAVISGKQSPHTLHDIRPEQFSLQGSAPEITTAGLGTSSTARI